jgi:hypothetical protein
MKYTRKNKRNRKLKKTKRNKTKECNILQKKNNYYKVGGNIPQSFISMFTSEKRILPKLEYYICYTFDDNSRKITYYEIKNNLQLYIKKDNDYININNIKYISFSFIFNKDFVDLYSKKIMSITFLDKYKTQQKIDTVILEHKEENPIEYSYFSRGKNTVTKYKNIVDIDIKSNNKYLDSPSNDDIKKIHIYNLYY